MSGIQQVKGPSSGGGISHNNSNNFVPVSLANITGISYLKGNEDEDGSVRQIEQGGKFILQKRMYGVWGNVQSSNQDETILARSVKTGVGSFHLGDLHNMSSAGENVVFRNNHSNICFFPVWQGIFPDGTTLIAPQARVYDVLTTTTPNGASAASSGGIDALSTSLYASNISVFAASVVAAEAYTGTLRWNTMFVGGIEIIAFDFNVSVSVGDTFMIPFESPLDARAGANVTSSLRKPDGTPFQVRASTTMPTKLWYSITTRLFSDSDVFHQGNPAEAARALETLTGTDRLDVLHLKNLEQLDGIAQPWNIGTQYFPGSLITYTDGFVYKANGAITAGTAFATGVWGSANTWSLVILPATATPLISSGSGSVGVSIKYAREDHVHPRPSDPIVRRITASGTYTPTSGMKYCTIEAIAGGGSGGTTSTTSILNQISAAGAGGSGGYTKVLATAAQVGASLAITVGVAGVASATQHTVGGNGGDTIVGSMFTCGGGLGGGTTTAVVGALGASGGVGGAGGIDTAVTGASFIGGLDGETGEQTIVNSGAIYGGRGGSTTYGRGGYPNSSPTGATTSPTNGLGFGSGGGGAAINALVSAGIKGGDGKPGVVVITEYF